MTVPAKPTMSANFFSALSAMHGRPAYVAPDRMAFEAPIRDYEGMRYSVTDGVATIEVIGMMFFKSYYMGYEGIMENLRRAAADERVERILLNMHTPGGYVAGCADTADAIANIEKPVTALVSDMALSAGYMLASQADEIVVTQTGEVGSIGTVMLHFNYQEQLKRIGIDATFIYAGAQKTLGNPYQELGDQAREVLQAEIDRDYEVFVAKVASGRDMDPADVRKTEAAIFGAEEGVRLGLADRIVSPEALFSELRNRPGVAMPPVQPDPQESTMALPTTEEELQARLDAARQEGANEAASQQQPEPDDQTDGTTAAVDAERDRVASILSCDEAKGREQLAQSLATTPGMTLENAQRSLKAAPKASRFNASELDSGVEDVDFADEDPAQYTAIDYDEVFASRRTASGHA
ncbi:MAG: S49 family peptidase [Pseudomonadota bacterium]